MRLVFLNTARRFVGLIALLFFALPFGLSVTGCGHKAATVQYCNAGDTGPIVGQVATITLSTNLATTGESLNYGQIGQSLNATAEDCKGNAVSVKSYTYASTSSFDENASGGAIIADINPSNGTVCGGTWNRNSSGGVANYTTCTAPSTPPAPAQTVTLSVPKTPPAASTVSVGSSPFTYTATAAGLLTVQGGTVSSITTKINETTSTASSPLFVVPNETVTITYTVAPTTVSFTPTYAYTATASGALQIIGGHGTVIYDYVAATATVTQETSASGIFIVNAGDIVGVLYTAAPTAIFIPDGVVALVTATANGAVSNAIPIFVHPVATGAVLGLATADCTTDPGTDCCPNDTSGTPVATSIGIVDGSGCVSQTHVGQLVARVYANGGTTGDAADNITCQVGHLTFAPTTGAIVSIDQNGAATAGLPGTTAITATISNSSTATSVGSFTTCPPASIALTVPNQNTNSINVAINTLQPLTATVTDTQGNPITGLTLEFNSTTPQTIPTAVGSVTPAYPGTADITAVCQPASCNPAPFSQIGLYGAGKSITSNPITVTSIGTSSTVLYMGSTSSQYVSFRDFTTNNPSALIKLPYTPNSMVINQAGTAIYFGSPQGLMSIATATNTVGAVTQAIPGIVLSVSPDGSTVVVTDPTRQTISLVSAANNAVTTTYGGIGTSASWSPDTQAVYITTATLTPAATPATIAALSATPTITPSSTITPSPVVLTHSTFTDWQTADSQTENASELYTDVAVAVPSIGAFFAGPVTTEGRSYCPISTVDTTGNPPTVTNQFIPLAGQSNAITDQVAATTNGSHVIGAHAGANGASTLSDIDATLPANATNQTGAACPMTGTATFTTSYGGPQTLTGVNAATITAIYPSSNSAVAFVTYTGPSATAPAGTTPNALLPWYIVPTSGQGTLQYITLGNGATANAAPVSGAFSTDNFTFYVGTAGNTGDTTSADNEVHLISLTYPTSGAPTATETGVITPQLPLVTGSGYAPVNLLAQHPKKSTD